MNPLSKLFLLKPGEQQLAGYFGAVFLLIGVAIAVLRGSADALFFKRYGIEYLPLAYAGVGVLLAFVSIAYAAFVDRAAAERSLRVMLTVQVAVIAGLWAVIRFTTVQAVYPTYYVFYVIVSEVVYMHIMLYLSHNLEMDQMKRLAPLAFAGYTLGNVAGGLTVAVAAPLVGVPDLLWIALAATGAVLVIAERRHARIGVSPYFQPGRRRPDALRASLHQVTEGLRFARRSEMLRMAFASLFFMVMAFYVLSYTVNRIYTAAFPGEAALGAFLGVVTAVTSLLAVLAQLFVSNRLLERYGARRLNLVFPAACVLSYVLLAASFTVPAALVGSLVRDTVKPALRDPVLNVFYAVLPDSIRGRARALSLALVLPLAMLAAAGFLLLAQRFNQPRLFPLLGMAAAGAYLYFNLRMNRVYQATLLETLRQKLFVPAEKLEVGLVSAEPVILDELAERVRHGTGIAAVESAKTLLECDAEAGIRAIRARLRDAPAELKADLLDTLARHPAPGVREAVRRALPELTEPELRAAALRNLFTEPTDGSPPALSSARKWEGKEGSPSLWNGEGAGGGTAPGRFTGVLRKEAIAAVKAQNPELAAAGVLGIFRCRLEDLRPAARDRLLNMLESTDPADARAALDVAGDLDVGDFDAELARRIRAADRPLAQAALAAAARRRAVSNPELIEVVRSHCAHADPALRQSAVAATAGLADSVRQQLCLKALDDAHPGVRNAARATLKQCSSDFEGLVLDYLGSGAGSPRARDACLAHLLENRSTLSVFADLARREADHAMHYASALYALGERDELLSIVIRERLHAAVDRCLAALEPLEGRAAVGVIRAGLRTGEARHRASACEALRLLKNREVAAMLLAIIERPEEINLAGEPKRGAAEWKVWLGGQADPWLSECAQLNR